MPNQEESSDTRRPVLLGIHVVAHVEGSDPDTWDRHAGMRSRITAELVRECKLCGSPLRIKTGSLLHIHFFFLHRLHPPFTIKIGFISPKIREMKYQLREMFFLPIRLAKMKTFNELR